MRLSDLDYPLPPDRIAQTPVEPRDAARLLVDGPADVAPAHHRVADLPGLLRPGDVVVVNETRVIPARLRLRKATGGRVEVLLLSRRRPGEWEALVRPGRRVPPGTVLRSDGEEVVVTVGEPVGDEGVRRVRVEGEDAADRLGEVPLPPYVTTPLADPERYQTVYGRLPGSVAAPTAGLHLTGTVLDGLADRGIPVVAVELQVGLGTFRPIQVDDPADHVMHAERFAVPSATLDACLAAERVVAVGTTTVRALESAARGIEGDTHLYLRRGDPFHVVDVLLTNFHLPRSSLLVLIDAFVGPRWRRLYDTALAEGYRFLSFGDAMLVERRAA